MADNADISYKNGSETIDIFISYRRQDAEAFAYMLYRDLLKTGYKVFFDHKSIGGGNFIESIEKAIENCKDVIVILSKESLGDKILNENDIMRREIAHAIQTGKRIVGIMLPGFEDFPARLPEDLKNLPLYNCLTSKMEYYDAMFERLVSGKYLTSTPSFSIPSDSDQYPDHTKNPFKTDSGANKQAVCGRQRNKTETLKWLEGLEIVQKHSYMRLLLDLQHEFNSSPECMKLYNYLDLFDRNHGIKEIAPYQGNIPTDYATYLSFFETLYVIVLTNSLDISLIDEMFRFRFFSACNSPRIQDSELLPLGYQYPNIFALYDLWFEYVRGLCREENGEFGLNYICGWEYDLRRRYNIYCFAHQMNVPQNIRLVNKKAECINLTLRIITPQEYDLLYEFQNNVLNNIPDNNTKNIFEALTSDELMYSLHHDLCIGLYSGNEIAAFLNLVLDPTEHQNLLNDVEGYRNFADNCAVIDAVIVKEPFRGYGIQKLQLQLAEFIAARNEKSCLSAVVSPENYFSNRNFLLLGYQIIIKQKKYHSSRNYYFKALNSNGQPGNESDSTGTT
jgi:hypothetical protein